MNTTRAKSAAENFAAAIKQVAAAAAQLAEQSAVVGSTAAPQETTAEQAPASLPATILYVSGKKAKPPYGPQVLDVEIGGEVFTRANDQTHARRDLRQLQLYDQIMDHGISQELMLDYWSSSIRSATSRTNGS